MAAILRRPVQLLCGWQIVQCILLLLFVLVHVHALPSAFADRHSPDLTSNSDGNDNNHHNNATLFVGSSTKHSIQPKGQAYLYRAASAKCPLDTSSIRPCKCSTLARGIRITCERLQTSDELIEALRELRNYITYDTTLIGVNFQASILQTFSLVR